MNAPPAGVWLPVLTDVLERGRPPDPVRLPPPSARAVEPDPATLAPEAAATPDLALAADPAPAADPLPAAGTPPALSPETLSVDALMDELTPRLSLLLEEQVAARLCERLDDTVAMLLAQLDVNIREIVRDTLAERTVVANDSESPRRRD